MVKKYIPERGDIVWVSFNPQAGKEQAGKRPAVVISPSLHNKSAGLALMCPIISQKKGYPFEVIVNGKKIEGVVLINQIRSLDWERRSVLFIEKISQESLDEVLGKLRTLV